MGPREFKRHEFGWCSSMVFQHAQQFELDRQQASQLIMTRDCARAWPLWPLSSHNRKSKRICPSPRSACDCAPSKLLLHGPQTSVLMSTAKRYPTMTIQGPAL